MGGRYEQCVRAGFIIVEIGTDTGLIGTGVSYTVDIGGSAILTLIEDYLAGLVVGMDPLCYEEIWAKLFHDNVRR